MVVKKQKRKSLVKTARKVARKNISLNLITELKAVTEKLVPASKKIEKAIKKDAKQLAKKISRELVIDEAALVAAVEQKKDAAETSKTDKATPSVTAPEIVKNITATRKPAATPTAKAKKAVKA